MGICQVAGSLPVGLQIQYILLDNYSNYRRFELWILCGCFLNYCSCHLTKTRMFRRNWPICFSRKVYFKCLSSNMFSCTIEYDAKSDVHKLYLIIINVAVNYFVFLLCNLLKKSSKFCFEVRRTGSPPGMLSPPADDAVAPGRSSPFESLWVVERLSRRNLILSERDICLAYP